MWSKSDRCSCDTHNDRDSGGSAQDLLHQTVSVVQRLHNVPLALGYLKLDVKKRQRINLALTSLLLLSLSLHASWH